MMTAATNDPVTDGKQSQRRWHSCDLNSQPGMRGLRSFLYVQKKEMQFPVQSVVLLIML